MNIFKRFYKFLFDDDEIIEEPVRSFSLKNTQMITTEDTKRIRFVPEDSYVLFEFDSDLNVKVSSGINTEIVPALIDANYIMPNERDDEVLLQHTFVLMANEATEQIILGVNSDTDDISS